MNNSKIIRIFASIITSLICVNALAAKVQINLSRGEYYLKDRYHYKEVVTQDFTFLDDENIENSQRYTIQFHPGSEKVNVINAFVTQPDGSKVTVKSDHIFSRDSAENPNAPGFTKNKSITLVFPQLQKGSRVYLQYSRERTKRDLFGFTLKTMPKLDQAMNKMVTIIHAPKKLFLQTEVEGPFKITKHVKRGQQIITATLSHFPKIETEEEMVDENDVVPYFAVSTLHSWDEIGHEIWKRSLDKQKVTPTIQHLVDSIVKDKKGRAAAEEIFYWVSKNIQYLYVEKTELGAVIPHAADEILKNGFGDCKDHASLLVTLLKAANIQADVVGIRSGLSYRITRIPLDFANHVIVYIPAFDVFVDPTDPVDAFGTLNQFNTGKKVLAIADKPYFKTTPAGSKQQNRYLFNSKILVNKKGDIESTATIHAHGEYSGRLRAQLLDQEYKKVANSLLMFSPEGGRGNFTVKHLKDRTKDLIIQSTWTSPRAIAVNNDAYFTIPSGIDFFPPMMHKTLLMTQKRHFPFYAHALNKTWVYEVVLPKGATFKRIPKNLNFKNRAGSFSTHYTVSGNKLTAKKHIEYNQDVFLAKDFPAVKRLTEKLVGDARSVIGANLG